MNLKSCFGLALAVMAFSARAETVFPAIAIQCRRDVQATRFLVDSQGARESDLRQFALQVYGNSFSGAFDVESELLSVPDVFNDTQVVSIQETADSLKAEIEYITRDVRTFTIEMNKKNKTAIVKDTMVPDCLFESIESVAAYRCTLY